MRIGAGSSIFTTNCNRNDVVAAATLNTVLHIGGGVGDPFKANRRCNAGNGGDMIYLSSVTLAVLSVLRDP